MKGYLLVWMAVFVSLTSFAAPKEALIFKQLNTQDGLSQNTVRSILVDQQGFLWAGTLDGLNRYDGKNFITYKQEPGNPASLSDQRIGHIHQDKGGFLWIGKYDNTYSCYNPRLEKFIEPQLNGAVIPLEYSNIYESKKGTIWLWSQKNGCLSLGRDNDGQLIPGFYAPSSSLRLTSPAVQFIYEDSLGYAWVGCQSGLNRISYDSSVEQFFGEGGHSFRKAIESGNKIYFITVDSRLMIYDQTARRFSLPAICPGSYHFQTGTDLGDGRLLLINQENELIIFDTGTGKFEKNPFRELTGSRKNIQVQTDRKGGIWLYNHTGFIWHYNKQTKSLSAMKLIPSGIASVIDHERYNVFIDSRNIYWITTYGNGLFRYNPIDRSLENYKFTAGANSPASDYLLSICEDKSGNLWVGSEYGGIIKVVRQNYQINFIHPEPESSIGKSNNVKVIFEDSEGKIWVGTKNGSLYLYDKNLENPKCIAPDLNPYTITEDASQRIWIGTKGNGIYLFNLSGTRQLGHYSNNPADSLSLSHNSVFHLLRDRQQRIWVATLGGGINLAEENGGHITFRTFFNRDNHHNMRTLMQDTLGRIWAGGYNGIVRFYPDKLLSDPEAYTAFRFNAGDRDGLSSNDIRCIFEDSKGKIWIGTGGGGVNRYVGSPGKHDYFIHYTTQHGLAGNIISGILESTDNRIWVSSEGGLTRADKNQKSFMNYYFSERAYGNHYNENACFLLRSGNMLWGTLDGMLLFNPKQLSRNRYIPPVTFTDLYLYDQRIETVSPGSPLKESVSCSQRIDLTYEQNTFTLRFACLNLTEPSMNKYSYILEPYDKQWNAASSDNWATYKNLPPGKYTFRVKGSNADGRWTTEASTLEIRVIPPFWRSDIAYVFYVIITLMLLYITFRLIYKFNRLNNAVRMEKQLTDYKLRFFTNISHEFRTPLTLIRGAVENLSEQQITDQARKQVQLLNRNTLQLNRLIDQLLEFRKIQNNVLTLNLEQTNIIKFAQEIYMAFQESATRKQIDYRFSHSADIPEIYIDRGKVDKILFNLLSNAFKFTPAGGTIELCIEQQKDKDTCLISVKDSGIGIPKEKQHLLFSRFMQINFSSAGTGVGLSLVKEFAEVHKGRVWYEDNQGQGSIFRVELPATVLPYAGENFVTVDTADPVTEQDPSEHTVAMDETLAGWRVLVIDDNQDIRDFLKEELSKQFQVDTADNGKTGLDMAIESNPDLIICDVMMPEMDGFEVTRRLKNEFQTCHIPIILLTAHSSTEHQIEGIQCGADAYITKPFSTKYLMSRVYKLIEQREKLKQRFSESHTREEKLLSDSDKDKEFYDLINRILEEHLSNPSFSVDGFTELSGLKRTIFYKKIKGLTGFSPNDLIKIKRMKKAAELLEAGKYTVSEVSWQVGIEDPFYFSKCFKAQFGCSPSKYAK